MFTYSEIKLTIDAAHDRGASAAEMVEALRPFGLRVNTLTSAWYWDCTNLQGRADSLDAALDAAVTARLGLRNDYPMLTQDRIDAGYRLPVGR